jgi:thiamine pyrophosphokinase
MYALLICNGDLGDPEHARALAASASYIVCADGGANAARKAGVRPHCVIGDFDSIDAETRSDFEAREVRFVHLPEQEHTDLEKAVRHVLEAGWSRVALLGVTGALLDHTLGNFSILARYANAAQFTIFDGAYRIDFVTSAARFECRAGTRVSIVPLPKAEGVTYEGLEFPLRLGTLETGVREGTCNRAVAETFSITVQKGLVMVFREQAAAPAGISETLS